MPTHAPHPHSWHSHTRGGAVHSINSRPASASDVVLVLVDTEMDKPLPEVFSPIKLGNGAKAMLQPLVNVLAIPQFAIANPAGEAGYRFFKAVCVVEISKPLMRARFTSKYRSMRGPCGGGSQLEIEAVPQTTIRAPMASCA